MPDHLDQVAAVTVCLFVAGLIFDAGRKTEQLRSLNAWRTDVDAQLKTAGAVAARVEQFLRDDEAGRVA